MESNKILPSRDTAVPQTIEIIDLHWREINLLRHLRNVPYGRVVILMRDGLPIRTESTTQYFNTDDPVDKNNY